jgi:hypothetical protein
MLFLKIAVCVIILVVGYLIYYWLKTPWIPEVVHSNWHHYFVDLQFSTKDFYHTIETLLEERKVPEITSRRVIFPEAIFSNRSREYLRIKYGAYSFDICAAPYGNGFFVSWWFGEDLGCLMKILLLIPLIGWYLRWKLMYKTYYVLDCEAMFRDAIHTAVQHAMEGISTKQGLRALSELEWQPRKYTK